MAKQDFRQKAIRRGEEQLRREGLSVEDPPASSIDSLVSHFSAGRETDLAVVFLLGRIAHAGAVEALTRLQPRATDREVKREIRRSLFKLGQKGLAAPKKAESSQKAEAPAFRLGPEIEGYISSVDSGGNRLVWVVKPQLGSGIHMLQGVVNDREGLIQVGGSVLRRKELRRMIGDIKARHGVAMVPVPWAYADWILFEAFEKAKKGGRQGLEPFHQVRAHMNLARPALRPHPIYDHMRAEDARSASWRESSRQLLEEPEFRPWVLDEDWVRPYSGLVHEAKESRLVLNPLQKQERMGRLVSDIVQKVFATEAGAIFARRMEDMALYLFLTGRTERAQSALGVAQAVKEQDLGGLGIPFLDGLVRRSLAFYSSQEKEQEKERREGSSLIIKP